MQNPHTGDVEISLGGKPYRLNCDWKAVSEIEAALGKEAIKEIFERPLADIAQMLAICLQKNHPGVTAEEVMAFSPPMIPTLKLLDKAVTFAYFGADGIPEPKAKPPAEEKKS